MIRNRAKPLLKEGFLNIVGAVEMIAGLDYHHDNIVRLSEQLATGVATDEIDLYHEAVAYLNRMGQFYYFVKSRFVARAVSRASDQIPTIQKFVVFRMKNAANRSIDAPRDEPEDVQLSQAMSLTRAWGKLMTLKPGAREVIWSGEIKAESLIAREIHRQQWETRHLAFQIFDSTSGKHVNFTIQREHEQICAEAYALLSSVILWE